MSNDQDRQTVDEALRLARQRLQPPAGAAAAGGAGLDLAVQIVQQVGPDLARIGLQIYNLLRGRGEAPGLRGSMPEAIASYVENAARHAPSLFGGGMQALPGQQQPAQQT